MKSYFVFFVYFKELRAIIWYANFVRPLSYLKEKTANLLNYFDLLFKIVKIYFFVIY